MAEHREPSSIVQAAADEVRALNLATASPEGFCGESGDRAGGPSEVTVTVQGLLALTERLPQAVEQLARAVQHLEEQQTVRMADGSDVGDQVSRVLRGLIDAQQAFRVAGVHLREAGGPLARMGGRVNDGTDLVEHGATGAL
ncbi:hypothetical protein ACWCPT_29490 [Streptomyces sp. NPDC002308]